MIRPLNLASRPLRNERLPTLLLLVALVALVGLSVRHAVAARDLLPERTATVDGELVALEEEVARLRGEAARLGTRTAPVETLQEWAVVRDLVDQRAFSWSALMGHLEEVVPPNIRLVSIAPAVTQGRLEVEMSAVGRAVEDGLAFLKALQESPRFDAPFLTSVTEASEGIDFSYTLNYTGDDLQPVSEAASAGALEPVEAPAMAGALEPVEAPASAGTLESAEPAAVAEAPESGEAPELAVEEEAP